MQNDAKYTSHPTATCRSSWRAAQLNEILCDSQSKASVNGCWPKSAVRLQPCGCSRLCRWQFSTVYCFASPMVRPCVMKPSPCCAVSCIPIPESRTEMTGTGCLCWNLRHWLRLAVSGVAHINLPLFDRSRWGSGRIPMWRSGRKSFSRVIISSFILPCGGPLFRHAPRLAEEVIPAVAIIGVVEEAGEEIAHCVECEFPIASQVLMVALCSWSSSMKRVVNLSCKWVLVSVALFLAPHFTHCQHIAGCIRCQIAVSWLETAIVATCNSMGMALSVWRSGLE